jgi:sec-independent protein translocase protein TatB
LAFKKKEGGVGFGIGWSEVLIVILVAVLFVKPERLPETARFLGQTYRKLRRWFYDISHSLEKEVEVLEEEVASLKKLSKSVQTTPGQKIAELAAESGLLALNGSVDPKSTAKPSSPDLKAADLMSPSLDPETKALAKIYPNLKDQSQVDELDGDGLRTKAAEPEGADESDGGSPNVDGDPGTELKGLGSKEA